MNVYKLNKMCLLFFCPSVSVSLSFSTSQRPCRGGERPPLQQILSRSFPGAPQVHGLPGKPTQCASVCVGGGWKGGGRFTWSLNESSDSDKNRVKSACVWQRVRGEIKNHEDRVTSTVRAGVSPWFSIQCKGTENLLRRELCVRGRSGEQGSFSEPAAFPCIHYLSESSVTPPDQNCSHFIHGEPEAERDRVMVQGHIPARGKNQHFKAVPLIISLFYIVGPLGPL